MSNTSEITYISNYAIIIAYPKEQEKMTKKTPEYTLVKIKDTQPQEYIPLKIIDPEDIPSLPQAKCLRCGHTWTLRTIHPKKCPKCKSPYWNKPRRQKKGENQ
jgi:rubrerythrin